MNRLSPKRTLFAIITLALVATLFSNAVAQRKQSAKSETTTSGSPVNAILELGSSVINSATSYVDIDPYSQFRDARYSNQGLLNERDEIKLGNTIHTEVAKKYKIVSDGQARVNRIGQRVARASLRPNLTYQFHIIKEKELNAFATPGGHIYVTTALVNLANDDELSSVLAHEVGHVVARHSLKTLEQTQMLGGIADLIGSVTGIAGDTAQQLGTMAAQIVGSGLLSVHNREEEREADFLGVHTMVKAGFNPDSMVSMFQKILNIGETNSSLLAEIFSDHPAVQERIDNTRYEINRMRAPRRRR
ncbi:MAG: M48 family metalloprotease [Acidobacteria bacterium]|nr:M48 family metalloprotease [Acidobacteriota bacterium]